MMRELQDTRATATLRAPRPVAAFLLSPNPEYNPFAVLREISDRVPSGTGIRLEVRGTLGSVEVAHALSIWRVCVSRGLEIQTVVFSELAYRTLDVLGLIRTLNATICGVVAHEQRPCHFHAEGPHHCPDGSICQAQP